MADDQTGYDICVVGLGYIGLPTASLFATQGFDVLGVDIDASVVRTVNDGETHIEESGLRTMVEAAVNSGRLTASTEPAAADTFVIAVPTPRTREHEDTHGSDLGYIDRAVEAIVPYVEPDNLVILESTSPPATTREHVAAPLEREGFAVGDDLYVAHCPERVLPGNILRELVENDRVVGGVTDACSRRAAQFYRDVVDGEIHRTGATEAELVKLMENTYRDVNIALANELADISDELGTDVREVIDLANRHPRVDLHQPGPGVGGHCLPVDPWFVVESAPEQARLIRQARLINQSVPARLAEEVRSELTDVSNPKVALFGVAYKGNVDDHRMAPAKEIARVLDQSDVELSAYDPHVRNFDFELDGIESAVRGAHAVVIASAHDEFKYIDAARIGELMAERRLFDFCNYLDAANWRDAGFDYVGRGRE
ncbi:MAG: nucleotide sugar dehydrogenase [Bradymonadaceae bacterium]